MHIRGFFCLCAEDASQQHKNPHARQEDRPDAVHEENRQVYGSPRICRER
jgi:hypothetical protein